MSSETAKTATTDEPAEQEAKAAIMSSAKHELQVRAAAQRASAAEAETAEAVAQVQAIRAEAERLKRHHAETKALLENRIMELEQRVEIAEQEAEFERASCELMKQELIQVMVELGALQDIQDAREENSRHAQNAASDHNRAYQET